MKTRNQDRHARCGRCHGKTLFKHGTCRKCRMAMLPQPDDRKRMNLFAKAILSSVKI